MLERALPPIHPGEILKHDCMEPLGLTVTETAKGLGVARNTLSAILNGRAGISPDMAIKLGEAFGNGPELWVNMQSRYDLWQAKSKSNTKSVKRFYQQSPTTH